MKNKNMLIAVVLIVIALGGGFFAGMQYQKSQRGNLAGGAAFQNGGMLRRFGQNGQNFRPVRGQVLSLDNTTMTVKLQNGNSEIVVLSPSTQYVRSATAAATDVKSGDTVMVVGTQNADGSVTADTVSLNPVGLSGR